MIAKKRIPLSWQRSRFDDFIRPSKGGVFKAERVLEEIAPLLTGSVHAL